MSRGLVPAARQPDNELSFPSSSASGRVSANYGSETPLYDNLIAEYRTGFRTVPGDPWTEFPVPHLAIGEYGQGSAGSDRLALPGGSGSGSSFRY